jgi:signal transduction histidine kinase
MAMTDVKLTLRTHGFGADVRIAMEAATAGAVGDGFEEGRHAHVVRVSEPSLRDDLAEYLDGGGWVVEADGDDGVRASWPNPRGPATDRVNLRFSVAVWRAMHDEIETDLELQVDGEDHLSVVAADSAVVAPDDLSHELRTPLTSILGYLELLLSGEAGPVTETQRRYLETIERNSKRLVRTTAALDSPRGPGAAPA